MISDISPKLERILEAGNAAPSGENCQPWRFRVSGATIDVLLLPERDQSAYSWGQRASYLAVGAALENIAIAASVEGYRVDVVYFPDVNNQMLVARVSLIVDANAVSDPLSRYIKERITNRKPYARTPLTNAQRIALLNAGASALVESPEFLKTLGRVGSTNEEVMLGNRALHDFFFSHVNWTSEEDSKKKIGFYIKTLELPPPAVPMFKIFQHWSVMRILAALGFASIVAKQNAAVNASCAAMGAFLIERTEPIDFVRVGRAIERTWLTATSLGLAFQPITGVLFFKLKIQNGEAPIFSKRERAKILSAYQRAADLFTANKRHVAFMFRIGKGELPSAHAVRFPLGEVLEKI